MHALLFGSYMYNHNFSYIQIQNLNENEIKKQTTATEITFEYIFLLLMLLFYVTVFFCVGRDKWIQDPHGNSCDTITQTPLWTSDIWK